MRLRVQTKPRLWYQLQVLADHFICLDNVISNSVYPIQIGLCSIRNDIRSKIILAGDYKQLDAICKSNTAAKLGFKISFMERLINRPLYQRHPATNTYNPKYITQLVQNYRSHKGILDCPNDLFYDGTLIAKAPKSISKKFKFNASEFLFSFLSFKLISDETHWFIGSDILINPDENFPIIFKAVNGTCKQSENNIR